VSWTGSLQRVRLYFEGPAPGIDYLLDDVACYTDTNPGGDTTMHVADLAMSLVTRGPNYSGRVTVRIVDQYGAPVVGATVSGSWSGATSGTVSGSTDGAGEVTFTSPNTKAGGTFTFTVYNVEEPGYVYAPEDNVETADSVTSP
ncbi:MAG: Ig-like domain-containing protein, partial [Xanthomonadales bacterium]|nr:Ig-like domain-containing protein [Xanthomonadales bacterium]